MKAQNASEESKSQTGESTSPQALAAEQTATRHVDDDDDEEALMQRALELSMQEMRTDSDTAAPTSSSTAASGASPVPLQESSSASMAVDDDVCIPVYSHSINLSKPVI
jgi:hypothetical protein